MIKVYTKPDCPQCKMTTMFLIRHHVKFLNINVSENPQYAQSLRDKGYRSVPINRMRGVVRFSSGTFKSSRQSAA